MPKVTVIIPVYNAEPYLDECLESVLGQSLADIEVICVDDGSTDGTSQLLKVWSARDKRLSVITQDNRGVGAARNPGLTMARGEYLCFVDSDDTLMADALQELVGAADEGRLDVLYFDAVPFCDDVELEPVFRQFEAYYRRKRSYVGVMPGRELMAQMVTARDYRPTVWSMLVRNEYRESIALCFFEGILHEDNLFSFLCGIQAPRAGYLGQVCYRRRVRKSSIMTMAKSEAHFAGFFVTCVEMLRYLTHNDMDQQTTETGAALCAQMYQQAIDVYCKIPASTRARVVEGGTSPEARVLGRILVRDAESLIRFRQMGESLESCENGLAALRIELESSRLEAAAAIKDLESRLADTKARLKKTKAQLKRVKESKAYRFARTVRRIARFGR